MAVTLIDSSTFTSFESSLDYITSVALTKDQFYLESNNLEVMLHICRNGETSHKLIKQY